MSAILSQQSAGVSGIASKEHPLSLRFYVPEGAEMQSWTITNSPKEGSFPAPSVPKLDLGWYEIAFAPETEGPTTLAIVLTFTKPE